MEKRCSRCDEIKPTSLFSKNRSAKDGLGYYCKNCSKIISRQWYLKNIKKVKASCLKWSHKNSKKCAERSAKWKKNNPEKVKEISRKYKARMMLENPIIYKKMESERKKRHLERKRRAVGEISDSYLKEIGAPPRTLRTEAHTAKNSQRA